MKIKTLFLVLFLLSTVGMVAQTTITGTVYDDNNMPLPGANVTVQGKDAYSITDFDGKFSVEAEEGDVLNISYLGFQSQKLTVGSETNLTITLQPEASQLDEVVVIGYGTQKKADVTGAVSSVKAEDLIKQPAVNATQSIQGKMSGVNIVNSNAPGATPNIIIRGTGTAAGGTNVLYVVDGIQTRDISNINPGDIESMNVLKDAASAAIYGMDAANGVVIITTKKGKAGKMKVGLNTYYGAKSMLNPVEMANASQYVTYFNERLTSEGATAFLSEDQPYDTDWYDALTDVGFVNNNEVTLSGASDNVSYYMSYSNYNEDGILKNNDYSRNTIRANNSADFFNDKLKLTSNMSASFIKSTPKPFSSFNSAYRQAPVVPVYYPDGKFGQPFWNQSTGIATYDVGAGETRGQLNSIGNPVSQVYYNNEKNTGIDLQALFQADLKVTDYLTLTSRFAGTKSFSNQRIFNDIRNQWLTSYPYLSESDFDTNQENNPTSTTYADNSLAYNKYENFTYNWDTYLTFNKVFNDKHNVNATLGTTRGMRDKSETIYMLGYNVPQKEQYWSMNFAGDEIEKQITQTIGTPYKQLSYFARLQYNYDSKYYLQANFRRDGVSTFKNESEAGSSTDYFGNFPSFSLGWALSNEQFFENVKFVNFLKLRAGWGRMGNSDVPFNVRSFTTNTGATNNNVNYVFGPSQTLTYGAALGANVYPISWEVTEETNLGFDFAMFNSKLSGAVNYYNRNTDNAILNVTPIYTSESVDSYYDHGAEISNKGLEFELTWRESVNEDFSYSVGATFSTNKNTVENVKSAYDGQTGGSLSNGQITKRLQEGESLYGWWMWEADGVWQTQDEIDSNAHYGTPMPGYLRYKDQNGDGVIDDNDKKFFGSYLPTYNVGLNVTLNYKNWDLSVDGFGAGGNKVYNALKGVRINGGENIAADVFEDRWTGAGSTNTNPGAARDSYASSYYLEDGDYFRINAMTIGYTLRDVIKEVSRIRIYATAQNPFLFTKYSGFTPEISGTAAGTGGIELSAYPNTKTFMFGVNVDL
ncbi:TonB-linked outer membrane protein, SusC/RagA family [Pustulibacterium marinum]|uniref:TonB-linked outer membrane protein, SusC/RagA family n=1 Tax=Pustulibacterium marinum TaxID=1224947 RepID=A0A1I7F3T2_9FLAO|nr:TonB-dependent receptor [Pustulibacterium marinum]SFU30784.1 TonB-linked outer membrane protein, SusC/RagA family [Pustulibacterium marinum]